MTNPFRWGILGAGNIAKRFAAGVQALPDAELVAVGSRTQASADTFGDLFNIPKRYANYAALAQDDEVDAIYIATVNPFHYENSLLCLNAGKAVLCEKPFMINAKQAEVVIQLAREKDCFLMEAMWTRFIPLMGKVRSMLAEGIIGDVRMLNADFGFSTRMNPEGRLFDPHLGGGALLDVGVYPISLASMIFGPPDRLATIGHLGETNIDEQSAFLMGYEGGQIALAYTTLQASTPQEAFIMGRKGRIHIHAPWWMPSKMTLSINGQDDELIEVPFESTGFNYEAAEVANCVRAGKIESDIMPLDETLSIMKTMDEARAVWGLAYPME